MNILAIETSSRQGSVAIARDDRILATRDFTAQLRHAGQLLPAIAELAAQAHWQPTDLHHLYFSAGPGSFTGLRIAVTVAKSLAFAIPHLKIVPVPSLDVWALTAVHARQQHSDLRHLAVVLDDAKHKMVFAALYEIADGPTNSLVPGLHNHIPATVITPAELLRRAPRPLYLLGPGATRFREQFTAPDLVILEAPKSKGSPAACCGGSSPPSDLAAPIDFQPTAAAVFHCGRLHAAANLFANPDTLEPFYLRRPEALERWEKLHPPQGS